MALLISKEDVNHYLIDVTRLVAQKLGAGDNENFENYIKNKNQTISNHLEVFIMAYKAWHNFHVETDTKPDAQGRIGIHYKLSEDEHKELLCLINKRDNSRDILINSINNESSENDNESSENINPHPEESAQDKMDGYDVE